MEKMFGSSPPTLVGMGVAGVAVDMLELALRVLVLDLADRFGRVP